MTDREIAALADPEVDDFSPAEVAALEAARVISLTAPDEEITSGLRSTLEEFYSGEEILELLMISAVLTGMAKLLFATGWGEREPSDVE